MHSAYIFVPSLLPTTTRVDAIVYRGYVIGIPAREQARWLHVRRNKLHLCVWHDESEAKAICLRELKPTHPKLIIRFVILACQNAEYVEQWLDDVN